MKGDKLDSKKSNTSTEIGGRRWERPVSGRAGIGEVTCEAGKELRLETVGVGYGAGTCRGRDPVT